MTAVDVTALSIRDLSDLTTEISTIDPTGFDWNDREADPGRATIVVQDDDPNIADLTTDKAVVVSLNGTEAFTVIVDSLDDDEVAPDEEAGEQTTAECRMLRSILDRARVKPVNGYQRSPYADARTFSCGSLEYDASAWGNVSIIVAAQADDSVFYVGLPTGWCDPTAAWVGPSVGDATQGYVGHWWTIGDFTLAADTDLVFFMAADNRASVYFDGFALSEIGTFLGFNETHRATVRASAGTHRIMAKVSNYVDGGMDPPYGLGALLVGNPTAFICSCFQVDPKGELGPLVIHTDAAWQIMEYPTSPPGMTVTQVAGIILDENQAEGLVPDVVLDPTDTLDSNGNALDIYEFITLDVGRSLLDVLVEWSAVYCDFDMPGPTDQTLFMWRWHERGTASGVTFDVDDDPAVASLGKLHRTDLAVVADALIVRWAGGQIRVPDTGGTKLGFLKLGKAASVEEGTRIATQFVAMFGVEQTMWSGDVAPTGIGDIPYLDFTLGDTVTVGGHLERAVELSGVLTEDGVFPKVAVRDLILDAQDRLALTVRRMADGTLGGDAAPASPAASPPPFGANPTGDERTFSAPDPIAVGEATKDKVMSFSGNLYAVAITLKTGGSGSTDLEFLVDGNDVLGGTGTIAAAETFALIPVDYAGIHTVWVDGNKSKLTVNVTVVGGGATGLLVEPRFL